MSGSILFLGSIISDYIPIEKKKLIFTPTVSYLMLLETFYRPCYMSYTSTPRHMPKLL